jgi:hypothetical protein
MEDIEYKGYTIKLEQDECPDSPDNWGNTDVFLVYDHRDFTVKRDGFEPRKVFEHINAKEPLKENYTDDDEFNMDYNDYAESIDLKLKECFIFPVDAYIHSGVHLSLAGTRDYPDRRWDVSTTGFVIVDKKEWDFDECRKRDSNLTGKTDGEIARYYAEGLIKTWNQYLGGEVYYMEVLDPEGNLFDSCGGYYGSEAPIEKAKGEIDMAIESELKEHARKTHYNRLTRLMVIDTIFTYFCGFAAILTIGYTLYHLSESEKRNEFFILIAFIDICFAVYYDSKHRIHKKERDGYATNR